MHAQFTRQAENKQPKEWCTCLEETLPQRELGRDRWNLPKECRFICRLLAGVAACEWSMNQIDNASNEQTIMSYLTNDAKLTAQIDAANDAKSYACCKTGSN